MHGKSIDWKHLVDLYEEDTLKEEGTRLIPKVKYEHIKLTLFSKMRVDLAAQVCLLIVLTLSIHAIFRC